MGKKKNIKKTYKRIVIKIGTNVLTQQSDGLLDLNVIQNLVLQVAELKKKGVEVIMVSSGAVGAGRSLLNIPEKTNKVTKRQVLSAVGQVRLMRIYIDLFSFHQLHCAQVLATKDDFRDRVHYVNMKNCFNALLRDNIIPVVNENDVVSVSELMFTDNDELAGLIASMVNADALVILSNVDGVYDENPEQKNAKVIPVIAYDDKQAEKVIAPVKSSFGRGGMQTKMRIARHTAQIGINTHIANGKQEGILTDIMNGKQLGTLFPAAKNVSSVKKWIAHANGQEKGGVYVNEGAEKVLASEEKVSSLLPVGIIKIEGNFEKGDVIKIFNEKKEVIGLGIAQYGSQKTKEYIGKKGKKALVHYDYLFIENT